MLNIASMWENPFAPIGANLTTNDEWQYNMLLNNCISDFQDELRKYAKCLACDKIFGTIQEKIKSIGCLLGFAQNIQFTCIPLTAKAMGWINTPSLEKSVNDTLHFQEQMYSAFPFLLLQIKEALKMLRQASNIACKKACDTFEIIQGHPEGFNCNLTINYF